MAVAAGDGNLVNHLLGGTDPNNAHQVNAVYLADLPHLEATFAVLGHPRIGNRPGIDPATHRQLDGLLANRCSRVPLARSNSLGGEIRGLWTQHQRSLAITLDLPAPAPQDRLEVCG